MAVRMSSGERTALSMDGDDSQRPNYSSALLHPVERDGRAAIAPPLAAARKHFVGPMFDSNDVGERHDDPALGNGGRQSQVVRWIGKGDIVRVRLESLDEPQGVGAMDQRRGAGAERVGVG